MRANVSVLTYDSQTSVEASVTGYENSVAAHVAGDWGAHNQVLFYATPFAEYDTGHTIVDGFLLRFTLTGINVDGSGDATFTCPAILTGLSVNTGGAPYIIRDPQPLALIVGQTATFTVKAISAVPLTYQWRKNGTSITGATGSTFLIANVATTAQATYDVIVANEFGSVTSAGATLIVQAATRRTSSHQEGCFLPDTLITMANGTQRQIKDVKVGDRVVSYWISGLDPSDENAWRTWATASLSVVASVATVKQVFAQRFNGYIRLLDLKVTYEHPLLVRRDGIWRFREVQDIKRGDALWKSGLTIPIDGLTYVAGDIDTYNLNVEETDVYLANGCMAHNNFFKSAWRFITPETALIGFIANGPL